MLTLTIVIPAFNEQDHLDECLASIAAQTVQPDEVIVVDNNSTDKTRQIAHRYPFVKLLREKRQGVVFARNKGFDAARGQIIGRIDADTFLDGNWVKEVLETYRKAGAPQFYAASAPSIFRNRFSLICYALHRLTYFWPSRLMLGHNTLVGSNMFITKALWLSVKDQICLKTTIHEDMDLAFHIGKAGIPIDFQPGIRASIVARKMGSRIITYPMMMLRVRLAIDHSLTD